MGIETREARRIKWGGHATQPHPDGVKCAKCGLTWKREPRSGCPDVPTYRDWDAQPAHLMTKTQMVAAGIKPGGPVRGIITMYNNTKFYGLFDVREAIDIQSPAAASRRAKKGRVINGDKR